MAGMGEVTMMSRNHEYFRAGVGLLVINETGLVLALERRDTPHAWQLPQGGLNPGEDPKTAAWRELREETGLGEEHVLLRLQADLWIGYELPERMRSTKTGRGQVHKWYVFALKPQVTLPPLPQHKSSEFANSRWISPKDLIAGAIDFRQPVYEFLAGWLARDQGLRRAT